MIAATACWTQLLVRAIGAGVQLATYDGVKQLATDDAGPLQLPDSFTTHVGCSVLTTLCAVTALQPFDFLAVRLMNQPRSDRLYTGVLDCALQTLRTEGPRGFFKGGMTNYARCAAGPHPLPD